MKNTFLLLFTLIFCTPIFATNFLWDVSSGDWDVSSNWDCGGCGLLPDVTDHVFIPAGTTINFTGDVTVDRLDNMGTMTGFGIVTVDVFTNGGIISPGNGATTGILEINPTGGLTVFSDLEIDIDNSSNDELNSATSNFGFSNNLSLNLVNGFTPNSGDEFFIVSAVSVATSTFSTVSECWTPNYTSTTVSVTYSPNTYYLDNDNDGFGNPNNTTEICAPNPPTGYAANADDCDDDDDTVGDVFTASIGGNLEFCPNGNTVLTASGGIGYTYLWSPGGETTASITVTTEGDYTVTTTTPLGCSDDETVTVSEAVLPNANFIYLNNSGSSDSDVFCSSNLTNSTFFVDGQLIPTVDYIWTNNSSDNISFVNDMVGFTGATISNMTPDPITFDVTLTAINTITGCSNSSTQTITANREVIVDEVLRTDMSGSPNDGGICFGDQVTFEGVPLHNTGNYTYDWSMEPSGTPIDFTGNPWVMNPIYDNQQRIYYLRLIDEHNCKDTVGNFTSAKGFTEVTSTLTYVPDCVNGDTVVFDFLGGNPTEVNGEMIYLVLDENEVGLTNTPPPYEVPIFLNPNDNETYTYFVRDEKGCGTSSTLNVQVPDDADGDGSRSDCDCDDSDPTEFPGQFWYIDADGDGYGSAEVIQCERPANGFQLGALTGNGTDDCDDNDPQVADSYTASISGVLEFCDGTIEILTASGGNGYTWLWAPNGETTQTITVSSADNYEVTVTSPGGCSDVASASVTVNAVPNADIIYQNNSSSNTLDVFCSDVSNNAFFSLDGLTENNVSYAWSTNEPGNISFINSSVSGTGATIENMTANSIDADVTLTATNDVTGCSASTTENISANREVIIDFIEKTDINGAPKNGAVCFGEDLIIEGFMLHNTGNYSYSWSMDVSGTPVESTLNPMTANLPHDNSTTDYYLTATDDFGCSDTKFESAISMAEVVASVAYVPDCNINDEVLFTFSGGDPIQNGTLSQYQLFDGNGAGLGLFPSPYVQPIFLPNGAVVDFTFTANDQHGCGATASVLDQVPDDSDGDGFRSDCDCNDNDEDEYPNQNWYIDADGDGYGANEIIQCARPTDGFLLTELNSNSDGTDDCNDNDEDEFPNQTWFIDADDDGYGSSQITQCVRPTDGFLLTDLNSNSTGTDDCNDGNAGINPGATEICANGIDENCDPSDDDLGAQNWYLDSDGDGFGDANVSQFSCNQPANHVLDNTDCNDGDEDEYPNQTWFIDADDDGYGSSQITQCLRPTDGFLLTDLNSNSSGTDDCDDGNAGINPGATEICANGIDENCDPSDDDLGAQNWYLDLDGDGFGDANVSQFTCTQPANHVLDNTDCNDGDEDEYPNQTWYIDADDDGYGSSQITQCVRPTDGFLLTDLNSNSTGTDDCDDGNAGINPGATEICANGIDENCDPSDDDLGAQNWYLDSDGDGFGDANVSQFTCTQPANHVLDNTDCNDNDEDEFPNQTWYIDADDDGYGSSQITQCVRPTDGFLLTDLNSNSTGTDDCDDGNSSINPGATEICANGIDENCDPSDDDLGAQNWYLDSDGDGFGDANVSQFTCTQPANHVLDNTDCNDNDEDEYPNQTWFIDADDDGYGSSQITQCVRPTDGFLLTDLNSNSTGTDDCDDGNAGINPGATEICANGIDENCDPSDDDLGAQNWYLDSDGDGFGDANVSQFSCNQPANHVLDNTDCNDNDEDEFPNQTWYIDADDDGYGSSQITQCVRPTDGFLLTDLNSNSTGTDDCDDGNAGINPGATEICANGIDENCDPSDDDLGAQNWYLDSDGDGFGDANMSQFTCTQPANHVLDNTDCNDSNGNAFPGATEICGNGIDDNCDGSTDEGCSGYCASNGQNSSQEWIKKVKYGGFNKNSGNDGGYADYTGTTAYVDAGQTETIQLKPQGNRKEWWRVWIDLNQDGDFDDADEMVFQTAGYGQRTATIIIPFSATAGLTQMRVSMKRSGYASDPCAVFSRGEVEDYSVDILVPSCGNLNSAWVGEDIGYAYIPGYECYDQATNEYTVASSGRDIFGRNDKFRFVSTSLCGDGEIIAEVTGMTNTGSYALAGVMMRATAANNSKYVGNFQRPNGGFVFQRRKHTNGYTASGNTWGGGRTWVRLVRIGNTFTGYVSNDGSSWTPTYYSVVSMPNCIEAGLAVSSYNAWSLNVSDFANVSVFPITNIGTAIQDLTAFEQTETFGQESLEDRETKISGFNAYKEQIRVRLDWFTGQEYLNDFFEIEKSTDGEIFEKIGEAKGQEFASSAEGYHFYDESPDFGLNYYRIKQIGIEGDEKYSEIREVDFNMNLQSLNVFPSPADQEVFVFDERVIGVPGEIELIDGNGIELQRFELEKMPSEPFRIDLRGLSDGLYFIRIEAEGFRYFSKMFMIARK